MSIFKRKYKPGQAFKFNFNKGYNDTENKDIINEDRLYGFFRKNSFLIALWVRELLWKAGRWENDTLRQFLYDFKPDVIFAPCFSASYTHKLLWYIQGITYAKVVLFHADDHLTVKGLGGSPLSRIKRSLCAKTVTNSARKADLNYCISPKQQEEYYHRLKRKMKLLYKGADFSIKPVYKRDEKQGLISIVYVGSTLYGRWKTLGMLARAIQKINAGKPVFELLIYSQYQPSHKAVQTMVLNGASCFMGKVPAAKISQVLNDADIVLHVESFDKRERLATKLSFSTKIVDCLHSGRCVFAIGWEEAASIDYLIENDAAIVATDEDTIMNQLNRIINDPNIILEYAQKAWECGKRNHQIDVIQRGFYNDLAGL